MEANFTARTPNKTGGGAKTNTNGLNFERETSLLDALISHGFIAQNEIYTSSKKSIIACDIYIKNQTQQKLVGEYYTKHGLYKKLLESHKINWENIISKQLLPDDAFLNLQDKHLYIIEKKYQDGSGSVDEKLQSFPFKIHEYKKLVRSLNIEVSYIYILCDWFKQKKYDDVYNYMTKNGCQYVFNTLPLSYIGLQDVK